MSDVPTPEELIKYAIEEKMFDTANRTMVVTYLTCVGLLMFGNKSDKIKKWLRDGRFKLTEEDEKLIDKSIDSLRELGLINDEGKIGVYHIPPTKSDVLMLMAAAMGLITVVSDNGEGSDKQNR